MPYILRLAKQKNLLVKPNRRTSHEGGIPNIGGINIFTAFIIPYFLFNVHNFEFFIDRSFIAGMYFILLLGFYDDLMEISALKKLLGEIIAGLILIVIADVRLTNLHGFLGIHDISNFLSYPLSLFVFLLIVNALNLIDGVDGLASGLGIIYCAFFGIYFELTGDTYLSIIAYSFIGSLLIFFFFNVFGKKKKIFMGDCGSLVLGYTLYMLTTYFCEENSKQDLGIYQFSTAPVIAFSVLILPLFDTFRVMLTRVKKGHSPFSADKNHMHHLLLSMGIKHRNVTFILLSINTGFIILALLLRDLPIELFAFIIILLACIFTMLLWKFADKYKQN